MEEATSERLNFQQMREVVIALAALRKLLDAVQEVELARVMAQLEHVDERDREVVRQFGQQMVEQLVHHLVSQVRQVAETAPHDAALDLLVQVFVVSPTDPDETSRAVPASEPAAPRRSPHLGHP